MKLNKEEMIITIDSELYSNGEKIAKELSQILQIPCYGEEILDRASEISKIPNKLMHRYDGKAVHAAYDLLAEDESQIRIAPAADFITAQVMAAKQLAAEGSCILVDRHANMALAGQKNHVSVYVHADFEDRAKAFAEERGMSVEEARKSLKKEDKAYSHYYKGNNKSWGDASRYDIAVNVSEAGIKAAVDTIVSFLDIMAGEQKKAEKQVKVG